MKVVISDYYYEDLAQEQQILSAAGHTLEAYRSSTEAELIARAQNCDALIVQFAPVTRAVIESMPSCRVIVRYAIGYDTIDLAAADEAGIIVCNVPDYCIDEVSTHALTLLLACAKQLQVYTDSVRNGTWDYTVAKPLHRLSDARVGLVGFGAISQMLAKKLQGLGVSISAYDPYLPPERIRALGAEPVGLDALYAQSDIISLHCPLNAHTAGMLNAAAFSKMKPGVVLVNTARGGLIDEAALKDALEQNIVAAAGLDVLAKEPASPSHPFLHDPRVILTPHVAWYSEESVKALQRKVAEEVARVLRGDAALHMVNHPGRNV